ATIPSAPAHSNAVDLADLGNLDVPFVPDDGHDSLLVACTSRKRRASDGAPGQLTQERNSAAFFRAWSHSAGDNLSPPTKRLVIMPAMSGRWSPSWARYFIARSVIDS